MAYEGVRFPFQQLGEQSPDKGKQGKKKQVWKKVSTLQILKKKSNSTVFKNIQLLLEQIQVFFWLPGVYYRQNITRILCCYKVHIYCVFWERTQIETYTICL